MRQIITALMFGALVAHTPEVSAKTTHTKHHSTKHRAKHAAKKPVAVAPAPASTEALKPPAERANLALADFAAAYSRWQTERRCNTLDPPTRDLYLKTINEDVERLSAVFGQPLVLQVALAAPNSSGINCDSAEDDIRIGLTIGQQIIASLKTLPPDFKSAPAKN